MFAFALVLWSSLQLIFIKSMGVEATVFEYCDAGNDVYLFQLPQNVKVVDIVHARTDPNNSRFVFKMPATPLVQVEPP